MSTATRTGTRIYIIFITMLAETPILWSVYWQLNTCIVDALSI